jgi:type IX secretion system PorP/SprF family membrane protein
MKYKIKGKRIKTQRPLALFGLLSLIVSTQLNAQQVPALSHYYYNPYLINPAEAGSGEQARAFLFHRQQWVGIPGAPETSAFTVDGKLDDRPIGLGLSIINDQTNILGRISAMVSGSYTLKLATDHALAFGMSVGGLRNQVYFDKINGDATDPGILNNIESKTVFDGNAGLSYRFKKLNIGLASEQIFNRKISYENAADSKDVTIALVRHYIVSARYDISLTPDLEFRPVVLLRSAQGLKSQIDINAGLNYRDVLWTNLAYRHRSGFGISLGTKISERFIFGYTYEIPTSELRAASSGSHEFMVGMRFIRRGSAIAAKPVTTKAVEDLRRDTNAQYEKLDELQQKNEALNDELLHYKQTIEQQNNEIQELKKSVAAADEELKATIARLKVDLQNETSFDKAFNYYLIIGAVKSFEDAKSLQKVIRRETSLSAEIIQNDNQTWYFIYSEKLESPGEARKKLRQLNNSDASKYVIGNPWVYKAVRKN